MGLPTPVCSLVQVAVRRDHSLAMKEDYHRCALGCYGPVAVPKSLLLHQHLPATDLGGARGSGSYELWEGYIRMCIVDVTISLESNQHNMSSTLAQEPFDQGCTQLLRVCE